MFLYDIGVALYARAVAFVALWNKKAKQFTEGRKNIFERHNSFSHYSSIFSYSNHWENGFYTVVFELFVPC